MGREVSFERDDLSDNQSEARKSSPLTANPEAQVFVWEKKFDGKFEIDNGVVGSNSFKAKANGTALTDVKELNPDVYPIDISQSAG